MADYYINSDYGKQLAGSLKAGDMAEASDGSTWRKEADGSVTVWKNGQTMTGRVGVSAPAVSEAPSSSASPTVETPTLDAATGGSSQQTTAADYTGSAQEQRDQEQAQARLASEKAKAATEKVTAGLDQSSSDELLNQAIQQASTPEYKISSAQGVLLADELRMAGDMAEASDGSTWRREADGSISVRKGDRTYKANIDRAAAKQDPQWAILTAPAPAAAETGSGKKSSRKSSSGSASSGSSGTYTFPAASTGTQKTPTATATGTDRASLRKQAATAQKEMGDLARQISVAKIRGKDTSALQAKYNEAKARYDAVNTQIQAPQQLSTSGARREQFSQRQTLMELATQQAGDRKDAWKSLPTVRDSERFSGIDNVTTGRMRGAEQQQIAGAVKELQKNAWRSLPTVQDSGRFSIPSQTDSLMQQAIAQRQSAAQPQTDKGIGGKLFTMLGAGLGQFNASIANFADAAATAVETVEGYLNGGFTKDGKFAKGDSAFTSSLLQPIHDWAKYTQSTSDSLNERPAATWSDTKARSVANTIGTGVIAALPQAALALLTLGTSSAGTLTQTSSGLAGSIETVMRRISSDPSYWLSFMQETGGNFAEAKGAGATDEQAILAATIAGLANAAIEVGGGLENNNWMNDGTLSALSKAKNLIKGAIEEGGEELIQNPISRAMQKLVYDGDREWLSLDNTAQGRDAVFNPYQSAEEFATGAAVGGILGAGNFALNRALGSRSQNQAQNTQLTQDELLDAAMQATNRGETLTGPVQAANQTTQQTTQGTAERGAEGVITGNEASALDEAMRSTFTEAVSGISSDVATNKPQNVKNLLNATKEQITRFIQNAFNKQNQFQYLKISDVSPELAETLRAAGINVDGYAHALRDNDIRHVESSHGSQSNDKYKVTADMLGDVQNVIDNYDVLYRGFDTRFGNPTVVYEKRMGNRTFYVEEVMSDGVLGTKQMVVTGENSKPSFLKKYTEVASVSDDTDVPARSGSTGQSPPGNHAPDAPYNTSYNPTIAQPGNSVNQNVSANDMGAMRSQFESVPKQSQTQSNTINSMETDWDVPEAQRTPIMYDTISEAKSLDNARLRLAQDYAGEMAELRGKHNWSGEEVDMGMTILDNYRRAAEQTGDWTEYSNWRKEVSAHGTAAGQALQAYAKYSRQTGGGIVADASAALERAAKKTNKAEIMNRVSALAQQYDAAVGTGQENAKVNVNDLVDIIKSASTARQTGTLIGNKTPPIVNWAMNRIANYARAEAQAGGGENLDFLRTFAADSIYNIAADTRAVSAGEQVKTVRRMGMLSKVSTVMRNLVSNNVFDPIDSIARNVSVPLDMLVSTITGTRSVAGDASWFSAAKRKGSMDGLARACMEVGLDVDASGTAGKYENTSNRTFKMSGGVFSKLMSVWEAYQGYTLNATDEFQKGGIEASVQKGIDRLYERGKITDDSLRNAGEQEALYRTFQDKTVLFDAAIGVRNALNKAHIGDIGAGDIMLPFAQVPSNLGARAIEYSPAGLAVAPADLINITDSAGRGGLKRDQRQNCLF